MPASMLAGGSAPIVLGFAPMDGIHAEFELLLRACCECSDAELHVQLQGLVRHLRSHFAEEDAWMSETGFPPRGCHMDEHAAVLRSAAEVVPRVAMGEVTVGRRFVAELARWFPGHADYLDAALAAWMCKRRFGGKPVVLHAAPKLP